jgi:hypothetical protein
MRWWPSPISSAGCTFSINSPMPSTSPAIPHVQSCTKCPTHSQTNSSGWVVPLQLHCDTNAYPLQVLNHLQDWSKPLEGLRWAFGAACSCKAKPKQVTGFATVAREIALPRHATSDTILARNNILTLWRAFQHFSTKLHTILSNAELLSREQR